MGDYRKVADTDDLKSGEMKSVRTGSKEILIAREGDDFYATSNKCPHLGGNLSKGNLDGHVITCPVHKSKFDLKTGEVIRWTDFTGIALALGKAVKKPKPLLVYNVKIEHNEVMVEL